MRSRLVVASVVVLLSCGGRRPEPGALSSSWVAPAILANVPADSPYLIASIEPVNENTTEAMLRGIDRQITEGLRQLEAAKGPERAELEPWLRAAIALTNEVRGKPIASWWRELGFAPTDRFVVYGLSAWPVVRVELANPTRLRAVIDRALSAAGTRPRQASLGGHDYWIVGDASVSFVAAVLEQEAVAAVLPTRSLPTAMPFVLGIQKPARNLATERIVPELIGRHHLVGFMFGYLDARNAIDIVTAERPGELGAPIRALTGPIPAACRSDLDRLAGVAPRLVFGYHSLDTVGFDGILVVEAPESVTGPLQKLHASVPELAMASKAPPMLALGAAINPDELVAWLRGVTAQLHGHPFACPWFAAINRLGDQLARRLATPLPPALHALRGFSLVVDDAAVLPPEVDGHVIVAGVRIAEVVSSLTAAIPPLAGLSLKPDGRPVALPLGQLGIPLRSVHVAMSADRIVIASGPASAQRATAHLGSPAPARSPMFLLAFDTPRLLQLLSSVGESKGDSLDYLGNAVMTFDVTADGIGFEARGAWSAPTPGRPPAKP